jgi:pimeloyl-ACP methyl ester carboxylesterase
MRIFLSLLLNFISCLVVAQNYIESKVPNYALPDLLTTLKGENVTNAKQWETVRRPELLRLFEDNVYGHLPKKFKTAQFTILREQAKAMSGKAKLKEVLIQITNNGITDSLVLTMFVPVTAVKPSAVFVLINNRDKSNTDPERGIKSDFWPAETLIASGYAIAAYQVSDLAPDDSLRFANRLLKLYPEEMRKNNGMRTISAWAFGASRVMDYLLTDKDIDAEKVILVGHSRGGKTALWAAANDTRFAMCIANCSGNTGAALSRRRYGQTVAMINRSFPHWFTPDYKKYNDAEGSLPVDQHMLIALIAPRPVYITAATQDRWADPKGMYLALKSALPAYSLYHPVRNLPFDLPEAGRPLWRSTLAYHIRAGKHDLTLLDWENFIGFANKYFNHY